MKDLTKYFIDLSKCSEDQQKHIFSLLPEPRNWKVYAILYNYFFLNYDANEWMVGGEYDITNKTELAYSDFIKLFECVEGEKKCCDNPDIQWNKIEVSIGDKQGSYKDLNFNFCDNCGETFNEAFD